MYVNKVVHSCKSLKDGDDGGVVSLQRGREWGEANECTQQRLTDSLPEEVWVLVGPYVIEPRNKGFLLLSLLLIARHTSSGFGGSSSPTTCELE